MFLVMAKGRERGTKTVSAMFAFCLCNLRIEKPYVKKRKAYLL